MPSVSLREPVLDKGYCVEILEPQPDTRQRVLALLREPQVKEARPFLQGDSADWLLVEFWTSDQSRIQAAFRQFQLALEPASTQS